MTDDPDAPVTRREIDHLKEHFDGRFEEANLFTAERFKTARAQTVLMIGVSVGIIKFDLPASLEAGAIFLMIGKGALALLTRT